MSYRTPVTILTGFLGSGKTTLLNRILTERHGLRIAVIENEFGEIGIDHELVINAEEEIFEMNNGCICCTVRGDLIRIMGNLAKRRDKFDHVIIETTGLADPGPVVQTFFVDTDIKESFSLDAVITLVDAKHVLQHIDESTEAKEQIAFADILLLNKSDLLTPAELDRLEARIKSMNGVAQVHRTVNAQFEVARILNVGGFNLERAIGLDPKFLEPEYPFEWGGLYLLPCSGLFCRQPKSGSVDEARADPRVFDGAGGFHRGPRTGGQAFLINQRRHPPLWLDARMAGRIAGTHLGAGQHGVAL